jgi:hypothetical protein
MTLAPSRPENPLSHKTLTLKEDLRREYFNDGLGVAKGVDRRVVESMRRELLLHGMLP